MGSGGEAMHGLIDEIEEGLGSLEQLSVECERIRHALDVIDQQLEESEKPKGKRKRLFGGRKDENM